MLRDRVRSVRIRHEVVGEDYHLVGVVSIGQRVTERTADALGVLRARVAAGVAERVGRRSAEERHVDVQLARSDSLAASAVRAEHHRLLHQSVRNLLSQFAAQTRCRNLCDHAVADVLDERFVHVLQARSCEVQILESHLCELSHNHVHHLVSTAEVVVERYCHAVLQSRVANSLLERHEFGAFLLQFEARRDVLVCLYIIIYALSHCLSYLLGEGMSFVQCAHAMSSCLITPEASAKSMTRCARITTGRSTILPFTAITPEPFFSASLMAAITASALSIAF